jgi:hypothetical protein
MRVSCQRPVMPELCSHGEQRAVEEAEAEALEEYLGSRGATRYQTVHQVSREDWWRLSRPPWRGMEGEVWRLGGRRGGGGREG